MHRSLHRATRLLAPLTAVVLLASCGGDDDDADAAAVTTAAPGTSGVTDLTLPEGYSLTVAEQAGGQSIAWNARYDTSGFDVVQWHADVTAAVNPPAASILRGDVIPAYGGDTLFANTVAAYESLSPALQRLADELRAVHRFRVPESATDDYRRRIAARPLVTEHPVVRVHPETRERALYVNPSFTTHLVGVSPHESRRLLALFYEALAQPQHTVRFRWAPGSVAFWDNRATVHLAPKDNEHLAEDRQLYRVTLVGDVPVGPDGRPSVALEGEPFEAL